MSIGKKTCFFGILSLCGFFIDPVFSRPYLKIQQLRSLNYPYIKVELSVSKLAPLLNLSESNFEVYENNWRVSNFQLRSYRHIDETKNIVLLIDSSGSLSKKDFQLQLAAVRQFVDRLQDNDKMAIISFHDKVEKHCGFTSQRNQIKECLNGIQRKGKKTLLFDAIFEGASLAAKLHSEDRKFMVMFTDGKDEGSVMSIDDDINFLAQKNIPSYVVATGNKKHVKKLMRLTNLSGGEIFYTSSSQDLNRAYQLLSYILDNTYLLQYVSQAAETNSDGRNVSLEIRFKTDTLQDQDTTTFVLPENIQQQWFRKMWRSDHILFYLVSTLIILTLIILVIFLSKRQKIKIELPENFTLPAEPPTAQYPQPTRFSSPVLPPRQVETKTTPPEPRVQAYLIEQKGPGFGRKFNFQTGEMTIGSQHGCDILIRHEAVAPLHAKIVNQGNSFVIYDLISVNGVYLNGKKLLRPKELKEFDEISIGPLTLLFRLKEKKS